MTTSHQYNHQDYVPNEGLLCPICQTPCLFLQDLNSVRKKKKKPAKKISPFFVYILNKQLAFRQRT